GLRGKIVIDSRGIPARKPNGNVDNYGIYDETLRLLDLSLRGKPNVLLDEKPGVIPPGTHDGVAVYVGWYSVKKYVPGMSFLPGAVGFHVASYEMLSLRNGYPGWVPRLLEDGVIGTMGPVAEPYLSAFPKAHDFVLLLLTGELTMGELYWATNPMVSWQVGYVGDPLYKPFALTPLLGVDELPGHLRGAVANPKSQ
ncbi:MAG: TIGR03790 family protein, partial [Planctomycetota bacterium]